MGKAYHVVITAIDAETKEETVEVDAVYTGLTMVADRAEKQMTEIVLHDNLANIASKLASGNTTSKAVRIAALLMDFQKDNVANKESELIRSILGGV